MISITTFHENIHEYAQKGKNFTYIPVRGCRACGYQKDLHRHGYYSRTVYTHTSVYTIYILRVICPCCRQTYSLIPSFLIPYRRFSLHLIIDTLRLLGFHQLSLTQVAQHWDSINKELFPTIPGLSRLKRRFILSFSIINSFFTRYPTFHYSSDITRFSEIHVFRDILKKISIFELFHQSYFTEMGQYFLCPTLKG